MNKTVIQQFNEAFQKGLCIVIMPAANITDKWFEVAKNALKHASPVSLGISADDFISLYDVPKENLTLMQYSCLHNNLEKQTATSLDIDMDEYLALMHKTSDLGKDWNNCTEQLHTDITKQLAEEALAQKERDKAIGGFVSIPAEA